MNKNDLEIFLPKYLSPDTKKKLLKDLDMFPENIDKRIYGFNNNTNDIFQGDVLDNLLIVSLPDNKTIKHKSMIISNTCDINQSNISMSKSNISYAPLINLEKYTKGLLKKGFFSKASIESHLQDIKKQRITNIFYLPRSGSLKTDSIIMFDTICFCNNSFFSNYNVKKMKIFSLSQYGYYLLLFKLSIHFTRFNENIDRKY